jgi:ubiquinone/menaquinone biosynthesis C-methylase UbiE
MAAVQTNESPTRFNSDHLFDNAFERNETRSHSLSALYNARTIRCLKERGVEEGWSCLEVGGGGGSITSWLCAQVGVTGRVLATGIERRFLQALPFPNLEVWRHDISQEPLPTSEFDLVRARLVLIHPPERESALRRMVTALKLGGWIVIDESDELSLLPDLAVNPGA